MMIRWTQILILSNTIWSFSALLLYFYYLNSDENKSTQNYPHDPPERSIIKNPIAEEISDVNITHPSFNSQRLEDWTSWSDAGWSQVPRDVQAGLPPFAVET